MSLPRVLAVPAALAVVLTIVGAWVEGSRTDSSGGAATLATSTSVSATTVGPAAPRTSCTSVVHVGDSTSVSLIDADLDAQYRRVGVTDPRLEISGGRSIVETLSGQTNAAEVAAGLKAAGYEGCWVLALGTTDTANVAVGGSVSRAERIDRMLAAIGDDPILWVNAKTLEPEGAWSNEQMLLWNQALVDAAARYPNITIYDWAAVVQDAWFGEDRIHYTPTGSTERARLIADALLAAYPS